jgi:hypothetical protein
MTDGLVIMGRIIQRCYEYNDIRTKVPSWDDYDDLCERTGESFTEQPDPLDAARIKALKKYGPKADTTVTENVILDGFLEYIVDHIDSTQSPSTIDASHLAIGDGGSNPSSSNTGLNNEVHREAVDSTTDNGKNLTTETLIGTGEANGNTFREVGLVSASTGGTFFNHSLVSEETKTSDVSITYEVELQFRNA